MILCTSDPDKADYRTRSKWSRALRYAAEFKDLDVAAVFPDGVIDFGFEAQFGEMTANRCFAVLLENLTSPVRSTGVPITVDATARPATMKAKIVAKRS